MKGQYIWNQNMNFTASWGEYKIANDAPKPMGKGEGVTPKDLAAQAVAGCSAMDIISLLKKFRQNVTKFWVDVDYEQTKGEHPIIFKEVRLEYHVEGEVEPEKLIKAVTLSQTKYCGVTAMISKTSPVYYKIYLNSEMIGEDQASFN